MDHNCLNIYAIIYRNLTKQSVHSEQITIEQQATENKSDAGEDSEAWLDSKGW